MVDTGVELALNTLRWFFLPIDEDIYEAVNAEMLSIIKYKPSPIFRGDSYRLKTLHNLDTDLSMIPAPTSGLKGLKAIQRGLHPIEAAPNTKEYIQLSGFDERVHGYKAFGLLFYHPKNKSLLDITIQIPEGAEEDKVILDIIVFVPHYQSESKQLKRYLHYRRQGWRDLVDTHVGRTLELLNNLPTIDKEEKIKFYKAMAQKKVKAHIRRPQNDIDA